MFENQLFHVFVQVSFLLLTAFSLACVSHQLRKAATNSKRREKILLVLRELQVPQPAVFRQMPVHQLDPAVPVEGYIWYNISEGHAKIATSSGICLLTSEQHTAMFAARELLHTY